MHTKEPWPNSVKDNEFGPGSAEYWDISGVGQFYGSEQDARRIVACVNACAGIPTELLEKDLISPDKAIVIKEQRDELLVALKDARASFSLAYDCAEKKFNDECLLHIGVGGARADKVIAKCES